MLKIFITSAASKSFLKDLNNNNIKYNLINGFTTLEVEKTNKSNLAIKLVKERFGNNSIKMQG